MVALTKEACKVHAVLATLDVDAAFIVRFALSRKDMTPEQFKAEWGEKYGRREEAAKLEQHRQDKIISDFLETDIGRENRDAIAKVIGVEAVANAGSITSSNS